MLLSELHGYKQYLGKSARKVLQDLSQKHGAYAEHGAFAVVVLTRHDFVYKLWRKDRAWESWLDYVKQHPNKHFIKLLSPIKEFPFELANPTSDNPRYADQLAGKEGKSFKLKYCRLEKLKNLTDEEYDMIELANGYPLRKLKFDEFIKRLTQDMTDEENDPKLVDANADFLKAYYEVGRHFEQEYSEHDMHADNVMKRADGTLVITDPASTEAAFDSIEAPELVQLFDTELKRA